MAKDHPGLQLLMRGMFRGVFGAQFPLPADLLPVEMKSRDGSRLEAAVRDAGAAARGVLILCHPFLKYGFHYFAKSGILDLIEQLQLHIVVFNFKGFGRSELKGHAFYDDVIGAVDFAKQRYPGLPINLFGMSFGAYHAIHALARIDGQVDTALFDSAPPDAVDFFTGPVRLAFRALNAGPWGRLCGTEPVFRDLGEVKRTAVHLLLGEADRYIPHGKRAPLAELLPPERITWSPGAGHMEIHKQGRDAYARWLRERLPAALAGSAAQAVSVSL